MAQIPALRRGFLAGRGCFSLPNRTRFAGLRFGFGRRPENVGFYYVSMLQKEARLRNKACLLAACQKSVFFMLYQWILPVEGFPLRGSWQPQAD